MRERPARILELVLEDDSRVFECCRREELLKPVAARLQFSPQKLKLSVERPRISPSGEREQALPTGRLPHRNAAARELVGVQHGESWIDSGFQLQISDDGGSLKVTQPLVHEVVERDRRVWRAAKISHLGLLL
jgi:hypothetical protein